MSDVTTQRLTNCTYHAVSKMKLEIEAERFNSVSINGTKYTGYDGVDCLVVNLKAGDQYNIDAVKVKSWKEKAEPNSATIADYLKANEAMLTKTKAKMVSIESLKKFAGIKDSNND